MFVGGSETQRWIHYRLVPSVNADHVVCGVHNVNNHTSDSKTTAYLSRFPWLQSVSFICSTLSEPGALSSFKQFTNRGELLSRPYS